MLSRPTTTSPSTQGIEGRESMPPGGTIGFACSYLERLEQEERASRGMGTATAATSPEEAALNRAVLTRALVESGLLAFTSQRVASTRQS
jgi:hypothetical protein